MDALAKVANFGGCAALAVELRDPRTTPVYQQIAAEAAGMQHRGVRVALIAKHFGVDHHTVDKAIRWFRPR